MSKVDEILATDKRYAGILDAPRTVGYLVSDRNLYDNAKLNAARAIVAERLVKALQNVAEAGDEAMVNWQSVLGLKACITEARAALAAWRELETK